VSTKKQRNKNEVVGFLGVGLDNKDEHQRITQSEHFLLVGGSAETHEHMQDTVIRFEESLSLKGKPLQETSLREAIDMLLDAMDH
jgi:hypothetical protein